MNKELQRWLNGRVSEIKSKIPNKMIPTIKSTLIRIKNKLKIKKYIAKL